MVKLINKNRDWVGVVAAVFGTAVVVPALTALLIAIGAVLLKLL